MEQNDKTKEGQQENKRDVRQLLDEALKSAEEMGKRLGRPVSINEKKGPIVIFNPPRSLVEKVKRVQEMEKKKKEE